MAASRSNGRRWPHGALQWSLVGILLGAVAGQGPIGTDICGCQPATYTFTLDFGLICDDTDVAGPGINGTACLTEVRRQSDTSDEDLVPVTVQNIQIFELDQSLQVSSQTVRSGTFTDGSTFTYTSIISTMNSGSPPASLPRGLQLVITGLNENEESTVNTFVITYTNDCGVFPILTEGQTAGWVIFVRNEPAVFLTPTERPGRPLFHDLSPGSHATTNRTHADRRARFHSGSGCNDGSDSGPGRLQAPVLSDSQRHGLQLLPQWW